MSSFSIGQLDEPNRAYDLSAVLRIWGHCDGLQEADEGTRREISWNISLESHDYVDLTRLPTVRLSDKQRRPLAPYFAPDIRQCTTARQTTVRLDRLSDWEDWKPYVQELEYFDKFKKEWTIILVCLFDRSRCTRTVVRGTNIWDKDPSMAVYRPLIPNEELAGEVGLYMDREHGEESEVERELVSNVGRDEGREGRQRERPTKPDHQPSFRRRLRQRARKGLSQQHDVDSGITSDTTLQSQLLHALPAAWSHVPHFLIGGASDVYHDAIVLGLSPRGKDRLFACMAISRKVAYSGDSPGSFRIEDVQAFEGSNPITSKGEPEYWAKFHSEQSVFETPVGLSQWYSYDTHRPLV